MQTTAAVELTDEERAFIAEHPTVVVGGEMDWPPMDYVEDGVYKGAAKDYLDEIARITGIEFDIVTGYTWSELMEMLRTREIDMVPMMYWTERRGREFNLTNPYITVRHYVFTNGARPDITDFSGLYDKTMAIPAGYAHIEYLNKHHPDIGILEVPTILDAIDALLVGRADAVIENTASIAYYAANHSIIGLAPAFPVRFEVDNVHMAVRNDWPVLRDILQKALDDVSTENTTRIMQKWTGSEAAAKTFLTTRAEFTAAEKSYLQGKGQLVACLNKNRMPLESVRGHTHEGMTADYLTVLADTLKIPVAVLSGDTWQQTRDNLAFGACDFITLALAASANARGLAFSTPYIQEKLAIATRLGEAFYEDLSELSFVRVGVVTGYTDIGALRRKYSSIDFVEFATIDAGLDAVAEGEIFGLLDYVPTISAAILRDYARTLKISGDFASDSRGFSFALRQDDAQLAAILDKAVEALPDSLRQNIHRKWVAVSIEKQTDYALFYKSILVTSVILLVLLYRLIRLRKTRAEIQSRNLELRDINTRLEEETDSALRMAYHDALTGLPNRAKLLIDLDHSIKLCKRSGGKLAVLFLDLDRFKPVNDTLGHDVGDKLLKDVSERIQSLLRETDTLCRLGGDEFVIVLEVITDEYSPCVVAQRVIEALIQPFRIEEHTVTIGTSVGIGVYPDDADQLEALIKCADSAMYAAKEGGRNTYRYFRDEMTMRATRRLEIESALQDSLNQEELSLVFRPVVHLESRTVTKAEAFVRWNHADLGNIVYDDFVSLAEKFGLIADIGESVLHKACESLCYLKNAGSTVDSITVNVSRADYLKSDVADNTMRIIGEYGVRPEQIAFEVPESAFLEPNRDTEAELQKLGALRHPIWVNEFGKGCSSLRYMKQLPLSVVKIDRSLMKNFPHDQDDIQLSRAIIALAHNLGYRVIAAGVDSQEQMDFLVEQLCDYAQGSLFGDPVPVHELPEQIERIHTNLQVNVGWTSRFRALRISQ